MIPNYDEFCYKCFNILNGIVNPINKSCRLDINRNMESNIFGERSPYINSITIYPYSVWYLWSHLGDDFVKTIILDTIVHELFHCDQIFSISKYSNDEIYRDNVEGQVVKKTSYFILNNLWLEESLGFTIDQVYIANRIAIYDDITTLYRKTNAYNVYRDVLYNIICDKDKHILIRELLDECKTVGIMINEQCFVIKENNTLEQDLYKFNQFMYDNMYKYSIDSTYSITMKRQSDVGLIEIEYTDRPKLQVIIY